MKNIIVIQSHTAYENNILKSDYFKEGPPFKQSHSRPNSHLQDVHVKKKKDEDKDSQE